MKMVNTLLFILLFVFCANAKENIYTGSTPAGPVIRLFLGISLKDSIDFIRWQLILDDKHYTLNCNYGISQPNTNGFKSGGKKIDLTGTVNKEKNHYQLQNDNKNLKMIELNTNLLHLLDTDNSLLTGNSGWSYTLNNRTPHITDQINVKSQKTVLKDSMAFEGRTPCGVPGIIPEGKLCYKLKWRIVLYANTEKNEPGTYKVYGTPWRKQGGRTGKWKIVTGKDDRIIYQLNDENGNGFVYLLKLDEHILVFADAERNLLVGNEDFSYTMNRIVER